MKYILLTLFVALYFNSFSQKKATVLFYNVENLFDTIDTPEVKDEEYLPTAPKGWNTQKYNEKISHITQVMSEFENLGIMGLCEIENANVVQDIVKAQKQPFKLVHFESADARGIDVALLYQKKMFCVKEKGILRFSISDKGEPKATRDILFVQLKHKKSIIHVLVNHWPSRSGGQAESEPNRLTAAATAKKYVDSVLNLDPFAKIILMGDLNDYPNNSSVQLIDEQLDPMIVKSSGSRGGSYNYRGEWDILDHMMVSKGLISGKGSLVVPNSGRINEFPYLFSTYKDQIVPFRTYARDEFLGGYSDHLPVSFVLSL